MWLKGFADSIEEGSAPDEEQWEKILEKLYSIEKPKAVAPPTIVFRNSEQLAPTYGARGTPLSFQPDSSLQGTTFVGTTC